MLLSSGYIRARSREPAISEACPDQIHRAAARALPLWIAFFPLLVHRIRALSPSDDDLWVRRVRFSRCGTERGHHFREAVREISAISPGHVELIHVRPV